MAQGATSRRAILTGALASAAVIGLGASRVSAAARPATDDGITVTQLRADECTFMEAVYGVNQSGQMVGSGLIDGTTYGPLLWSGGTVSTPLVPDGAVPLELLGISDSGQYAGAYYQSGMIAALWTGGVPRPIRVGSFPHTRAACMDAAGRVLVQARTNPANPPYYEEWTWDRLFLCYQGRITPVLPPDGAFWPDTRVIAMNNRGAVLAQVRQPGAPQFAPFLWQAGRSTWLGDIGAAGSTVLPAALNDLGQVAGTVQYSENGTQVERAFRWWAGRSELSPARVPGAVEDGLTVADSLHAINMRGDVVGFAGTDRVRPFLWSGSVATELPVPDDIQFGWAWAVNEHGDVCGTYFASHGYRACLWHAGRRIDLPTPEGSYASQAQRVDDRGQILSSFVRPPNEPADRWIITGTSTSGGSTGGSTTSGGSVTSGGSTSGGTTGSSTTSGGSVTSGGSTSGGTTGGGTTGGGTTSGGSVPSGGSTIEGATDTGATTGGTPGCHASVYNCVQWTVRA